ncbi:MAG: acyl-CoA dehydratase activase [Candidatus Sumerlaeia bacterium]
MIAVGIDAGSRAIKIVLLDGESREVVAAGQVDQGIEQERLAMDLLERLLAEAGLARESIKSVIATGYGRNLIGVADRTVTEITCHARGVRHQAPHARTIIEIGGQDSKLIRLDARGAVQDFAMNDRCAAGTGRFLEVVAGRLGDGLNGLGKLAARAGEAATISSMCVVFAETEIIGLLAAGTPPESIAAGVQATIASRVCAMAGRRVDEPVVFTGGVALIPGMREALSTRLARPVETVPDPRMTGALGAALIAMK